MPIFFTLYFRPEPRTLRPDHPGGMMQTKSTWQGLAAGVGAFTIWGLLPLYWKALKAVPPL